METTTDRSAEAFSAMEGAKLVPVLVCSGAIRGHLRGLLFRKAPLAAVLSYEEVTEEFRLEVRGSVALDKVR